MKLPNLSFIVTAAGESTRFINTEPKQFLKINKIPIYIFSLLSIKKIQKKSEVFLTINKKIKKEKIQKELNSYNLKNIRIVYGGSNRAESVQKAFKEIKIKKGLVVIHDSVRPNFDFTILNKVIEESKNFHGIIVAAKIQDTVKKIQKTFVAKTIKRDNLWLAETPQIFKYSVLKKCYANKKKLKPYTDESQLLEQNGYKIKFYENLEYNNKITTKKDMAVYKKLLIDV